MSGGRPCRCGTLPGPAAMPQEYSGWRSPVQGGNQRPPKADQSDERSFEADFSEEKERKQRSWADGASPFCPTRHVISLPKLGLYGFGGRTNVRG